MIENRGSISVAKVDPHIDPQLKSMISMANRDQSYQAVKSCWIEKISLKSLPMSHPAKVFSKQWNNISLDPITGLLLVHDKRLSYCA